MELDRRVDAMTATVWLTYAAGCDGLGDVRFAGEADSPLRGSRKCPGGGYLERVGPFRMSNSTPERSGGGQKGNAMARTVWLSYTAVCDELGVAPSTMSEWRLRKIAPPMKKLPNGRVMCRREDLDQWCDLLEAA